MSRPANQIWHNACINVILCLRVDGVWDDTSGTERRLYRMLIRWFKARLPKGLVEDVDDSLIRGPGVYLCNKTADAAVREVAFWGNSTPGMRAASRYR